LGKGKDDLALSAQRGDEGFRPPVRMFADGKNLFGKEKRVGTSIPAKERETQEI